MDLLFWHHDATGFLALAIVAWALVVVSALFAARLEERAAAAEPTAMASQRAPRNGTSTSLPTRIAVPS